MPTEIVRKLTPEQEEFDRKREALEEIVEKRLAAIEKRMGRLEQLINVLHGKKKERSLKHQRRIELLFDSLEGLIRGNQEQVDCALGAIQEQLDRNNGHGNVDNNPPLNNQPKPRLLTDEQKTATLREVAKSLRQEQIWRDQKAREYGWPLHPSDMDWLDEGQRKAMLKAWSERGEFRQEWLKPDDSD
jgi:hypothetical protein